MTELREGYLSRKQLAAELGLSLRTIAKFDSEGMPRHQWGLRTVRYRLSEVEAWLQQRGVAQVDSVPQQGRHPTAPGTDKRSSTDA